MLWEVEIETRQHDPERDRVSAEFELMTHGSAADLLTRTTRGFLLEGDLDEPTAKRLVDELLADPLVESASISPIPNTIKFHALSVLLKPGVMDPVAQSIVAAGADLGIELGGVRSFRR